MGTDVVLRLEERTMDAEQIRKMQEGRSDHESESFINKLDKWLHSEQKSRALAIHAFCCGCMGCTPESNEPGYQSEIRTCTATMCPLYSFRPYK